MADGRFAVYNADGSLQFDTSNRLFRPVITFTTTAGNGSRVFPGISAAGELFAKAIGNLNSALPKITFSGDTAIWTFDPETDWGGPVETPVIVFSR